MSLIAAPPHLGVQVGGPAGRFGTALGWGVQENQTEGIN